MNGPIKQSTGFKSNITLKDLETQLGTSDPATSFKKLHNFFELTQTRYLPQKDYLCEVAKSIDIPRMTWAIKSSFKDYPPEDIFVEMIITEFGWKIQVTAMQSFNRSSREILAVINSHKTLECDALWNACCRLIKKKHSGKIK